MLHYFIVSVFGVTLSEFALFIALFTVALFNVALC